MTDFNKKMLKWCARLLGSPWAVYLFTIIAIYGFPWGGNPFQITQWFSSVFIQFVALAIIQGASNLQSEAFENFVEQILARIDQKEDKIINEEKVILQDLTKNYGGQRKAHRRVSKTLRRIG